MVIFQQSSQNELYTIISHRCWRIWGILMRRSGSTMSMCLIRCSQSVVIKYGIRKIPDKTRPRRSWRVEPSKGKAPQTSTYRTTPKLYNCKNKNILEDLLTRYFYVVLKTLTQTSAFGPSYSLPSNNSGAAYGGLPHHVESNWPGS